MPILLSSKALGEFFVGYIDHRKSQESLAGGIDVLREIMDSQTPTEASLKISAFKKVFVWLVGSPSLSAVDETFTSGQTAFNEIGCLTLPTIKQEPHNLS